MRSYSSENRSYMDRTIYTVQTTQLRITFVCHYSAYTSHITNQSLCYGIHGMFHTSIKNINQRSFLPILRTDLPEECLDLLLLSQSDLFLLRLRFLGEDSSSLSRSEQGFLDNFIPLNLFSLEFETSILRRESERE
jgi:hypothetical protein